MSPEYRSVLLLVGLAAAGQAARCALLQPGDAPGGIVVLGGAGSDSASALAHRDSARAAGQPLKNGELVDLDQALAPEIARLPGVGAGLARRIVEHRQAHGSFGGLAALDQVPGVGPALLKRIGQHARFSGTASGGARIDPPRSGTQTLGLNSASVNDLALLPWIGPARAAAIVAYRESHGPFASIDSLAGVPGIGPATLAKLRPLLEIR